jgi:hypothetical protein
MVRHAPIQSDKSQPQPQPQPPAPAPARYTLEPNVDVWVNEQMFEEDVRAVLRMMRPNGRERLAGWKEYRTGGAHYRITVSWDDEFEITSRDDSIVIPHMSDVIETLLVGSAKNQDDLTADQEYEQYRSVLREVYQRIDQRQSSQQ